MAHRPDSTVEKKEKDTEPLERELGCFACSVLSSRIVDQSNALWDVYR